MSLCAPLESAKLFSSRKWNSFAIANAVATSGCALVEGTSSGGGKTFFCGVIVLGRWLAAGLKVMGDEYGGKCFFFVSSLLLYVEKSLFAVFTLSIWN